jgi:hypothetical protein
LEKVSEILPLGQVHWQQVAERYNKNIPTKSSCRVADNCKRKFISLKNTTKTSGYLIFTLTLGNPNIPKSIEIAKELQREIDTKCSVLEISDDVNDHGSKQGSSDEGLQVTKIRK